MTSKGTNCGTRSALTRLLHDATVADRAALNRSDATIRPTGARKEAG